MPATVTLATATLALPVGPTDGQIKLSSTSGIVPGLFLWLDKELVRVLSLGVSPWVNVIRGQGGTGGIPHASGVTVYIGRGDQFYSKDPVGRPPDAIHVSPWINTLNGKVWWAQGDPEPPGFGERWWQEEATVYDVGALGVRTKTSTPTSST